MTSIGRSLASIHAISVSGGVPQTPNLRPGSLGVLIGIHCALNRLTLLPRSSKSALTAAFQKLLDKHSNFCHTLIGEGLSPSRANSAGFLFSAPTFHTISTTKTVTVAQGARRRLPGP
jgi:hypothetical protein